MTTSSTPLTDGQVLAAGIGEIADHIAQCGPSFDAAWRRIGDTPGVDLRVTADQADPIDQYLAHHVTSVVEVEHDGNGLLHISYGDAAATYTVPKPVADVARYAGNPEVFGAALCPDCGDWVDDPESERGDRCEPCWSMAVRGSRVAVGF